jgi:pyruvate dehydrogenase E2 component (dihydrolipoamide acetyltransferase)
MATDVIMPKVDMDQETGTVARWLKQEGDEVQQGEIILEIETDKVAIEVEAPASGILADIRVAEGETVPIATVIAAILAPGEVVGLAEPEPPEKKPTDKSDSQAKVSKERDSGNGVPITPVARKFARAAGVDPTTVTGSGPGGKVTKKDVEKSLSPGKVPAVAPGKVYATPAARHIANENKISLDSIEGSGPEKRIQAADVLAVAKQAVVKPSAIGQPISAVGAYEVFPLQGKRRTIAERLTASYQTIPHIHFTARIDMTRFQEARSAMNGRLGKQEGLRISATALMTKIVAVTLTRHRWLNSSYHSGEGGDEAEIHLFNEVNIGVAVALEDGLIVPVVHDAAKKGVVDIAIEVDDLATRARNGSLEPKDVRGGTFTISNLGPFGVEQFTAIINPPQAAILAVGVTQLEAVPDDEGQVVVRPLMHITLAADHRIVDGAVAASFMADLKASLEDPVLLLL